MYFQESPATNSMAMAMIMISSEVPRSGSITTSPAITSTRPSAGASVCSQVVHAEAARAAAQFEKPRQIENYGELGQFRRLQADRPDAKPAMRGMRFVQSKNADEHGQYHEEKRQHESGLPQPAVIEIDHGEHGDQAKAEPQELPQQKVVAVAVLLARRNAPRR